jgi:hypothetical protein
MHSISPSAPAGRGQSTARPPRPLSRKPFTREQRLTVVYGMLCLVLMLVVLQLWLLIATMNAFLGGDQSVIWPAAAASFLCLLLNLGLLRYLYRMERP